MASKKAEQDAKAKKDAEERKKAKEAAKAEEKAAKAAAREEARAAKEKAKAEARQAAIDSGELIVDGDTEYRLVQVDEDRDATLDERSVQVIEELKGSDLPVMGKDLQEKFGGGYPLYIPIFSTLKALGLIKEFRRRTGERGGGGKAYLWVGDK
jgi:sRNA-binding protein